jgi:serine phosphatase RsbU (regulator of sigma subunit)/anti-sigma regulatory factor (Ser/Thr protein kinase)
MEDLVLDGDVSVVPVARRFARQAAAEGDADVDDVELVVAELVTNAVLHGAPPIVVRISKLEPGVRIEVTDRRNQMPLRSRPGTGALTGRGLRMIEALAASWGAERLPGGGKVVWADVIAGPTGAETSTGPPPVAPAPPDTAKEGDERGERVFTVRLGAVPTDLLMEAKAHIDNVVREFTLARDGALSGPPVSAAVAGLIDTVTNGFADARTEIKRQALASSQRGETETELVLRLPASAADAAEAYLAALDEADRYARAARLLTLATPPAHRVFRRWYLLALVAQVRAQAMGQEPARAQSFAEALAEEVGKLSSWRDAANRSHLLEEVTGELATLDSIEEIAATVARNAVEFLGALVVRVHLLGDDGKLRLVAAHGGVPELRDRYREFSIDDNLPASVVVRSGQPLLLRNRAEIESLFPPLSGAYPVERILHLVPLQAGSRPVGCLALTFPDGSQVEEAGQMSFVTAIADTLAYALDRALTLARLGETNERLTLLADASDALASSLDYSATAEGLTSVLVPRFADWCVIQVVESGRLQPLAVRHADPDRGARVTELAARFPTRMDAPLGPARVVRTGRSELYAEVAQDHLERVAVDAEHLAALGELGMVSAIVAPLTGSRGTLGTLSLVRGGSGRPYRQPDVSLAEDLARRAAMALERARSFGEQAVRLANVTSIAQAAQQAILAPLPERIGRVTLSARYLSAAAEAQIGGDFYEVVARPGAARFLIGDVRGKGLPAVRTATVVLGEFRAAAAELDDLAAVAAQIDRRLRPYLDPEDFVTALFAEIDDDGEFAIASCGHPAALLATNGQLVLASADPGLPLGLGASPAVVTGRLGPGDRLLLYTDGIVEARDAEREYVDLMAIAGVVVDSPFDVALDRLLSALRDVVGPSLGDDLALLLAGYGGP